MPPSFMFGAAELEKITNKDRNSARGPTSIGQQVALALNYKRDWSFAAALCGSAFISVQLTCSRKLG
jgi:hypothetical protein